MKSNILLALAGVLLIYWAWSGEHTFQTASTVIASAGEHTTTAARFEDGQFVVEVDIDGVKLPFTVDTGATDSLITAEAVRAIGSNFVSEGHTSVSDAFGDTRSATTGYVTAMRIGDIVIAEVPILIAPYGKTNLLGLSALRKLTRFEYRQNELVLEQ